MEQILSWLVFLGLLSIIVNYPWFFAVLLGLLLTWRLVLDVRASWRERRYANVVFFALFYPMGAVLSLGSWQFLTTVSAPVGFLGIMSILGWLATALMIALSEDFDVTESIRRHTSREFMMARLQGLLVVGTILVLGYGFLLAVRSYAPSLTLLVPLIGLLSSGYIFGGLISIWSGIPVRVLNQRGGFH